MATFVTVFFGGVISALVTLLLGQPLQHYFWRRQRYAERQFAIIEEVNRLAAEVFLAFGNPQAIGDIHGRVLMTLTRVTAHVKAMFSESGFIGFMIFAGIIGMTLGMTEKTSPEQWEQAGLRLQQAHAQTLSALYHDMGIPPPSWRQWMREHMWAQVDLVRALAASARMGVGAGADEDSPMTPTEEARFIALWQAGLEMAASAARLNSRTSSWRG